MSNETASPKIEFRNLDELPAYARNARTHSDEQVAQLMGAILEFGWTQPVLADGEGIVAGHGRCMAARKLYAQGKTIKLPGGESIPAGTVPVIDCTGWSEAKRRAYILADNKLAMNAGWDFEMLAVELDDLRDMNFDMKLLGFSQEELNELIGTPNVGPLDGMPELPDGDREPFQQMTFTLHDDQAEQVKAAIEAAKAMGGFVDTENENSNGNALARICETFLTMAANA